MTYEPEDLDMATVLEEQERRDRERLARDDGEYVIEQADGTHWLSMRELRTKERSWPCAARIPEVAARGDYHGGWCVLPTGHDGACGGLRAQYQPLPPSPDRVILTEFRRELSEKYDTKVRTTPWIDRLGQVAPAGTSPARWWELRAMRSLTLP